MDLRATLPENALRFLAREAGLKSTDQLGRVVMFRKYHPGTRPWFQDVLRHYNNYGPNKKAWICFFYVYIHM